MNKSSKFPKWLSIAFALSLSLFILTGCTDDEPEVVTEPPVVVEPTPTPADVDPPADDLERFTITQMTDGVTTFYVVENPGDGPILSFGAESGMGIIEIEENGRVYAFRDLTGSGVLSPEDDWRLSPTERARAHSANLTVEQITGLMLFSPHQRFPADGLTDEQRVFMGESHLRNVLNAGPADIEDTVRWVNEMQAYAEMLRSSDQGYVPVNFATDPRSTAGAATYNAAGGNSRWPSNLGLAATFDINYMHSFAQTVTAEYRALGMTTALSPMIELATEPRWLRVEGTLGEDLEWASQLAAAYVAGYQGSYGLPGWGTESVNTVIKHFAGDGANEGGRGAHTVSGMYEVFPGGGFHDRLEVFRAALDSAALMTGYAVAIGADGEPLFYPARGVAFDEGRMGILRDDWGWEGVVVTDWGVTRPQDHERPGRAWYMEGMSEGEVMFEGIRVGLDMFGGNSQAAPVLEAFDLWQAAYAAGDLPIDGYTRWQQTGARVLQLKFQTGLFDNPFLVLESSLYVVGHQDKMDAGFDAQLASVVLAKNDGSIVPTDRADWANMTVYVPHSYMLNQPNHVDRLIPIASGPSLTVEILERYFGTVLTDEVEYDDDGRVVSQIAPDLSDVDIVLVGMHSPRNGNQHSSAGFDTAEGFWYPLSLQWHPYVADGPYVRRTSISGRPLPDGTRENRSYFGQTSRIQNEADIHAFERAVAAVAATGRDIPIITVLQAMNPTVPTEIYADSNAIVIGFGVSHQALLEIALGITEARGRLPITFPADMDAVERQYEDIANTDPFIDSNGNEWRFGFGLNFSGVIQ